MQMRVRANTFCHFDKWPERIGRKLVLNEIHFQKKKQTDCGWSGAKNRLEEIN